MNYKFFDLQKALAGDPVVTGEGLKVREVAFFTTVQDCYFPLVGVVGGNYIYARADGTTHTEFGDKWGGLFMAPKKVTYYFASWRCDQQLLERASTDLFQEREKAESFKRDYRDDFRVHTIEIEE